MGKRAEDKGKLLFLFVMLCCMVLLSFAHFQAIDKKALYRSYYDKVGDAAYALNRGDYNEAEDALDELTEKKAYPGSEKLSWMYGDLFSARGEYGKAVEWYEKSINEYVFVLDFNGFRENYAYALYMSGSVDKAEKIYRLLMEREDLPPSVQRDSRRDYLLMLEKCSGGRADADEK